MLANELSMVAHCAPLGDTAQEARYCHAVRMSRLDELFKQFPPVLPKRAGRKKGEKKYSDLAAKAEARRLRGLPNPPSLRQIALKVEPLAERGLSEKANFARVYNWLRGL